MKRILALVLCAAILLSFPVVPLEAHAATEYTDGYYTYTVTNGEATITRYTGNGGDIAIPSTLDGYPVTAIGDRAFSCCHSLTSVTIPDSVTNLGDEVFMECIRLTSVTIGNGVTTIGAFMFYGCESLQSVTIGNSVTTIYAFMFDGCESLTTVTLGNSVTTIADDAFHNCTSLTNITIPDSVTTIGEDAFIGCESLKYNEYDNGKYLGNVQNPYHVLMATTHTDITSCQIHKDTRLLNTYVFANHDSLTEVTIPDSVTSIPLRVFYGCDSLADVYYSGTWAQWYAINIAYGNDVLEHATIHCAAEPEAPDAADYACEVENGEVTITGYTGKGGDIVIPSTLGGYPVTAIGDYAFSGCSSLQIVTIPDGVTAIGDCAFYFCTSLESVIIPDSVTTIGDQAFQGCDSLTNITIPDSVTTIGDWAFQGCSNLQSVTIGDSVTSIGDFAFWDCSSLQSVTIPDSVTTIGSEAFRDCNSLTSITIPDSVTTIGEGAFYGCSLTDVYYSGTWAQWYAINIGYSNDVLEHATIHSAAEPEAPDAADYACEVENGEVTITGYTGKGGNISIPATLRGLPVTSIGWDAFDDCTSLESITIPDSVTYIGDSAFSGCTSLESITIPDGVTSIGFGAFSGCGRLESVIIPDSVTSIDGEAFQGCDSLTNITIPGSVTTIGTSAFQECSSLASITLGNGITTIDGCAFFMCPLLAHITIPDSVTKIGQEAFHRLEDTFEPDSLPAVHVYYAGSKAQWDAITIDAGNPTLRTATIHYNHTHDYSLFDPVTVQYCDQAGYTEYTCVYGDTHRIPLPALGHLQETEGVVTPPACTEDGYTSFVCARCNETVKTDAVPALGHDCTIFIETVAPSCDDDGYTSLKCSRCEHVKKTDIVYALGHNMAVLPAVQPTCTETGLTKGSVCARCRKVGVAQTVVPALEHNYENGICSACGQEALAVTRLPFKLVYRVGESLDLAGLTLLFVDTTGATETVTEGYTVSGIDTVTVGNKIITVTYAGFTTEFTITVLKADAQIYDCNFNAYTSLSEAIAAVAPDDTLTLLEDIVENVTVNKDVILDLNSFDITGTITVAEGCTLYGMDAQTDDYTINDGYGYGKLAHVVGNVAGLPEDSDLAEDGYLMIKEEDGISFHRVNLQLTHMTLRAESAGVYFKSAFGGDELVAENVAAFGVALSITDTPNQNNLGITSLFSRFDGANFTAGENRSDTTSTLLYDIMKTTNGRLTNTANARCPVHGRAYIELQDGSYLFGSVATRSLQGQIEMIDTMWEDLRDAQKTPILQMYSQFKTVMRKWNIPSIIEAAK